MSIETRLRETSNNPGGGGSASSSSSGLAGTDKFYLTTTAEGTLTNSLVLVPGSSATHHITGSNYYINAITLPFPIM